MSDTLFDELEKRVMAVIEEVELLRMEVKDLRDENATLKQQKQEREEQVQNVLTKMQRLDEENV